MTTTVLAYIPSPSQGVWQIGPVPLRAYALFIVLGMLVALYIGDKRWQARGGEPGVVYSIFWWAMPFGLIGGRLYHVITDWRTYFGDDGAGFLAAFRIWEGGLGIWGAVALGGVGAWVGCRQHGIPLPAFGDAVAPGIVLAQAIGRLGNYFNQELYGRPTTLPWGLEIYERRDASGYIDSLNGVSTGQLVEVVHPTFLYELLWNVLVFAALIYIDRRFKIGHGRLFAMYVAGYCVGRFWVELMRSDVATHIAGIRINSFTSTFVFIGAVVYIMVAPKGREDPASLKGKPRELEKEEEDTSVEEFVKELTGVAAATTGVVAAARVAGESEDEDAKAAADEAEAEEPEELSEAAAEAEALAEDVAAEAEEFAEATEAAEEAEEAEEAEAAAEGEEEPEAESESAAEAEALAEDVEEAPSEDIAEAEEFAEAKEAAEEAEEAEGAEAEELGADVAGVPADNIAEAEEFAAEGEEEPEAGSESAAEAEALAEDVEEAPSDDIAEAEEVAEDEAEPGADEPSDEAADEAEDGEPEPADGEPEPEGDKPEPDEPETEAAEAAVEGAEAEPSEEEAAEEAEAVVEEAEATEEDEPEAEVLAEEPEPDEPEEPEPLEESGGRLRRWLRGRRNL